MNRYKKKDNINSILYVPCNPEQQYALVKFNNLAILTD